MRIFRAYCDGSCEHGKSIAASAFIVVEDNKVCAESVEPFRSRSGNEAEMRAVILALESIVVLGGTKEDKVLVYTDFKPIADAFDKGWIVKWMNNGWRNSEDKEVKNKELWEAMWKYGETMTVDIRHAKRDELAMFSKLKKRVRKGARSLEQVLQAQG